MSSDEGMIYATTLRLTIRRLEQKLGDQRVGPAFSTAWEGEEDGLQTRMEGGNGHFAEALQTARSALASGDAEEIKLAATVCQALARTGTDIEKRHQRRAGGEAQGSRRKSDAEGAWEPWLKMFNEIIAAGETKRKARERIHKKMVDEGFVPPGAKDIPDKERLRKKLK